MRFCLSEMDASLSEHTNEATSHEGTRPVIDSDESTSKWRSLIHKNQGGGLHVASIPNGTHLGSVAHQLL